MAKAEEAEDISVSEACELLGMTHLEVNRRIHRGQIPARKVGYFWVLKRSEVEGVKRKAWYKTWKNRRSVA